MWSLSITFHQGFNPFIIQLGWGAGQSLSGRLTLVPVGVGSVGSVGIANMLANVGQISHHTTSLVIMIITSLSSPLLSVLEIIPTF